jgi:hypothetical protein
MRFNAQLKRINKALKDSGHPGANMDGAAFMSSLHNTASFIYTAMKAKTVALAALESLKSGKSPVITLYNTNESLLGHIGKGNQADVGRYLTFLAEKSVTIQMPDDSHASILTTRGYEQLARIVKPDDAMTIRDSAQNLMDQADMAADYLREQNIPASPIDRVKEIVEDAGYIFEEVTGRGLVVDKSGKIVKRTKPNPDTVVNAFNSNLGKDGKPNTVLLLNSSGNTGLSAHSNKTFKNRSPRIMFVLQPEWDVNGMMQMFGRINRKGQVTKPEYKLVLPPQLVNNAMPRF